MEVFKNNIEKLERLTRRERLGELLVRCRVLPLGQLTRLMEEHRSSNNVPFGEFLVEKSYITRHNLIDLLNMQKNQDRVIDNCLKDLGLMTNQQKWETLARHEKIGEILVKLGKVTPDQLVECMMLQEQERQDQLIGEIMVAKSFISKNDLKEALSTQHQVIITLSKTIQELMNISQLPIAVKVRQMNTMWGSI